MIRDCNHYRFAASLQEIDAAGAMYFGHLLNRAHLAYEALMTCIGFSLEEILSQHGYRLPLVHCEADFLRPVQHG
ncbi:MAG TPA: acyl-CoA thioesterase, partial [Sedimenticola sp.]|nr:acyl-CoA thioesterase [Sedimenticola sp.]